MKVETFTASYKAKHGKAPRGQGTWKFEVVVQAFQGRHQLHRRTYTAIGDYATSRDTLVNEIKRLFAGKAETILVSVEA